MQARWHAFRDWWVLDMLRQLAELALFLPVLIFMWFRITIVGSRGPAKPWQAEPDRYRPRRDPVKHIVMMCPTCDASGLKPMPWRNVPGMRRMRLMTEPTKRSPGGWGQCQRVDCRHGVLVERVPEF
ncbi:MAG: hypothetical protein QOF68_557 [Gaiellales bacterium]|nr:hypothetical protein [Gaiellales bacterium]